MALIIYCLKENVKNAREEWRILLVKKR